MILSRARDIDIIYEDNFLIKIAVDDSSVKHKIANGVFMTRKVVL